MFVIVYHSTITFNFEKKITLLRRLDQHDYRKHIFCRDFAVFTEHISTMEDKMWFPYMLHLAVRIGTTEL
jgi:hypothetical protein